MTCHEIQAKLPDYLSDLLVESVREEIRDHLDTCMRCQKHLLALGSFSSDLKRLAVTDIPFDLTQQVTAGLSKPAAGIFHVRFPWIQTSTVLLLVILIGYVIYHPWNRSSAPAVEAPQAEDPAAIFRGLQAIEAKLTRIKDRLETETSAVEVAEESPVALVTPQSSQAVVFQIQPLFWQLGLRNTEAASQIRERLHRMGLSFQYESADFIILASDQETLRQVSKYLENHPGVAIASGLTDFAALPRSEQPITAALRFTLPVGSAGFETPTDFFQIRFALKNRYLLKKYLQDARMVFLYEDSQLVIFDLKQSEQDILASIFGEIPGLVIEHGSVEELFVSPGKLTARIAIHPED